MNKLLILILIIIFTGCNTVTTEISNWESHKIDDFIIKLPKEANILREDGSEGKIILSEISIKYRIIGFDLENLNPKIYEDDRNLVVTVDTIKNYIRLTAINQKEKSGLTLFGEKSEDFLFPGRTTGLSLYAENLNSKELKLVETIFENIDIEVEN